MFCKGRAFAVDACWGWNGKQDAAVDTLKHFERMHFLQEGQHERGKELDDFVYRQAKAPEQ